VLTTTLPQDSYLKGEKESSHRHEG